MNAIDKLNSLNITHVLLNKLKLRYAVTWWLQHFPYKRKLPGGARLRLRYVESFVLMSEVLESGVYAQAIHDGIRYYADLGSNTGLFDVLMREKTGRTDLRGLAVDANPKMCEETRWTLAANGLDGVKVVQGFAGAPGESEPVEFYISDSSMISSHYPVGEPGLMQKGRWTKTTVHTIDVEQAWLEHVGDERCHLAKIDIEGGEDTFLVPDNPFLARVDSIVMEWHDWIVSRDEITARLEKMGFKLAATLEDLPARGVGYYKRV